MVTILYDKQTGDGKFKDYTTMAYHNLNTRRQYLLREKNFINNFFNDGEPLELTQEKIDKYMIWYANKTSGNVLYTNFIKAYLECYDPEGYLRFKVTKGKSRKIKEKKGYRYVDYELLEQLRKTLKKSPSLLHRQLAVMLSIYFDSGLRATELIELDKSLKHHAAPKLKDIKYPYGWNMNEESERYRHIWGIGKNYKPYDVRVRPRTAKWFVRWLGECDNQDKPFSFYKNKVEVKNPYHALWYHLRKVSGLIIGKEITPHQVRHCLGRFLRVEKGWDIMKIKTKLRHASVTSTEIYTPTTEEEIEKMEDETLFKNE